MKRGKVTIVVPVYNVSKFIDRCMSSLLAQTYRDLEIILINDGSSDNSLEIIKKYKASNPDIVKVYDQANHGPGYTRNRGLSLATGDYITFVDSDDYVDNDYIEHFIDNMKGYDCVFAGHKKVSEDGKILAFNSLDDSDWSKYKYNATWGKLYRLSYLKQKKICYSDVMIGEDLYLNMLIIASGARINTIDYCGYNYVQNASSITNTVRKKYDMLSVLQALHQDILKKYKISDFSSNYAFYLKTMLFVIILQRKILTSKEMNIEFNNTVSWVKSIGGKPKFFKYKVESLKIRLIVNIFYIGYYLKINRFLFRIIKFV